MFSERIKKIISDPFEAFRLGIALSRGIFIKGLYKITNRNIKIGSSFRAYSWMNFSGPGKVVIGDKVSVEMSFLRKPCILTHASNSRVVIGNGCYLGGTRISCITEVIIGSECLFGSSTIIDSDVIPYEGFSKSPLFERCNPRPIYIGNFFWSGTNSYILGGSLIGNECVLGAGSVFFDKEVPDRSLLVGNPARKIGITREV